MLNSNQVFQRVISAVTYQTGHMRLVIYYFSTVMESPQLLFYAHYHSYYTALKNYYDFEITNLGELGLPLLRQLNIYNLFIDRSSKQVVAAQITAMSYTPTTPFNQRLDCSLDETLTPSTFPSLNESRIGST